jgi:transglutaminase-like putative cysteine protease
MNTSRTVEIRYQVTIPEPRDREDPIQVWMPLPASTPHQDVIAIAVESPAPASVGYDPVFGNPILHAATPGQGGGPVHVGYRAIVERHEWRTDFGVRRQTTVGQDGAVLRAQLAQTRGIKFLPEIVAAAAEIRGRGMKPLDIARAAYDHVLATMTYDKQGEGWGAGDTEWACSMGRGNCTDFHTLFLAILRCAGVAGEFEIGAAFPEGIEDGDITHFKCGYHCWVRFFVPELGWVPADVSEASRHPEKRDYFFGAIDADRVMLSRGRDITMVPASAAGPENFFTEPRLERRSGDSVIYEKRLEFSSVQGSRT